MDLLSVRFKFNRTKQRVTIPADSMNLLVTNEIQSNANLYQKKFKVYGYMKLNDERKFVIHTMAGSPFIWQPMNGCSWDPNGSLYFGRTEIEPCKAKINQEFCIDEFFDGCFKHLLVWDGRGATPSLSAEGTAAFNAMVDQIGVNAVIGARLILTVGKLFKDGVVLFNDDTPNDLRTMFIKSMNTCKGWIELLRETAASNTKYAHLNSSSNLSLTGVNYTGSVVSLYDALVAGAKPRLRSAINQGGVSARGGYSLLLVTDNIFNKLLSEFKTQRAAVAQNDPRISQETVIVDGYSLLTYKIDSTYIIPLSEVSEVDQYLTGKLTLACLTVSEVINLGAVYTTMPEFGDNVGLVVEKETSARNAGMYYFAASNLFASAIADADYISAAQAYTLPA